MNDQKRRAADAARALLEMAGEEAVQEAAREAVNGTESDNKDGSFRAAVDAFWQLRVRLGIPGVRGVLRDLGVGTEGI